MTLVTVDHLPSLKLSSPLEMVVSNRNLQTSRGPLFSGAKMLVSGSVKPNGKDELVCRIYTLENKPGNGKSPCSTGHTPFKWIVNCPDITILHIYFSSFLYAKNTIKPFILRFGFGVEFFQHLGDSSNEISGVWANSCVPKF